MLFLIFLCALAFVGFLAWYILAEDPVVRRRVGLCSILAIAAASALSLFPVSEKIKLGLDLKGGTAFLIALDGQPSSSAREKAMQVIRKRVDQFGLSEPIIQPVGANRISVQIPGLSEQQKAEARQQLAKVAKLEFRLVHPRSRELLNAFHSGDPAAIPIDYEILPYLQHDLQGQELHTEIVVKRRPEMSGKYVQRAFRSFDDVGRATVVIDFTPEGQQAFGRITSNCIGQQMAIVLDREVQSAPEIKTAIFNNAVISGGNMTPKEADDLSSVLENPLETPVKLLEERGVDPSLGRDSIVSGRNASIVAVLLVMGFMILYYRWAGVIASVGMVLNIFMLLGMLAQFHFTLTLPGIAGIVLTIGMAVDANVLIYERIRDELALGKNLRAAVAAGFSRAFSAIFDAHVTAIIPAIILLVLGSGPLQGFAVTLTLGIVANLFAALVVTKNAFEWLLSIRGLEKLAMLQAVRNPRLDFIKIGRVASVFSLALLVWGICTFAAHRHTLLGVDFAGGDSVTVTSTEVVPPAIGAVRAALDRAGLHTGTIQYAAGMQTGQRPQLLVQARYGEGERVAPALASAFPGAGFAQAGLDRVGPVIGKELGERALLTLGIGLLGIMIYVAFRYEWSFSLAATLGQIHDVLIAIGVMALLHREFNMTLIGAFLTILGYSINDKIVISDRIRESWRAGELKSFYDIVNRGLNLTLARTLITGGTILLAVLSLLCFGGPVIADFALAMLIGIVAGIFSSHFLTPWLLEWFHGMASRRPRRAARNGSGAAPTLNGAGV
ncbi:MAG: protein translocase subunit SecD [Verrucomicrobium sp.]|nr:protein translocase subunit SecD [Verrucomicrobium sp.]